MPKHVFELQSDSERFYDLASSYLKAFIDLREANPSKHMLLDPKLFLLCRASELSLKSVLSNKLVPTIKLSRKEFGHNLTALFKETVKKGIKYPAIVRHSINSVNEHYLEKDFEYPQDKFIGIPSLDELEQATYLIYGSATLVLKESKEKPDMTKVRKS